MNAVRMRIGVPSVFLTGRPDASAEVSTELLHGEEVKVFFRRADWAEVESRTDQYRGFVPADALAEPGEEPTHCLVALRSFVFPEPNLKVPPVASLSFLSQVRPGATRNGFAELAGGGWIFAAHLAPSGVHEPNYARTALRFLEVPYLWGGRTAHGLDCSALVQLSLAAAGIAAPRDTGPQRAQIGHLVLGDAPPRARDLVFWPGHVGVMVDHETMVHANAHHMAVVLEPLEEVIRRAGAYPEVRRL
jgi:cell wall-associated NlpC family hydrolase